MRQTWRACAAFGAALLLAACSPATAPTGTPLPAATATAFGAVASSPTPMVFASKRYPYSIAIPSNWVATPAQATWDGTGAPTSDDPAVDVFEPIGEGAETVFASAAPTTSPLAAWVADGIATNSLVHSDTCPQKPDSVEPVTIGGQPGTLEALNCGILINTAFTVVNGNGYRFVIRNPTIHAATDPADKATFMALLGSVAFR